MAAARTNDEKALELARAIYADCVGVRVGHLHRLVSRRFEAALRPLGLTLVQMEILTGLTMVGEPVKPASIAEHLGVERSTMSRNLTLMESRDLISTTASSASGRSLAVAISERGTEAVVAARSAWTEAQESVISQAGVELPATLDSWIEDLDAAGSAGR